MALAELPAATDTTGTDPGTCPVTTDDDPLMLWVTRAACRGHGELFFSTVGERPEARARREERAKALCATCPSRQPCLWFGRLNHEYGIWGGENEIERVLAGYRLLAPIGTRHLSRGRRRQALAARAEAAQVAQAAEAAHAAEDAGTGWAS
jgi:WhiB family transcriptional regulator, redox-sensing transcriptional regulator